MTLTSDFVGAGLGFRKPYRAALLEDDIENEPAVLEVVPSHFFAEPALLTPLAERYPLVFHEVACSVGTASPVDREHLQQIKGLFEFGRPLFFTEHLALTTSPEGIDIGHLAPLWYTREVLDLVTDRVRTWQDTLEMDVALETITTPFVIPGADMTESEFFGELVDRTGCGLLLDVTNQLIGGHNLGFEAERHIAEYPLHAVMQVHLAGGESGEGRWVDSHSAPVDEASFELLRSLRGRAPIRTVIVERDNHLPPLAELLGEAARAAAIWEGRA